MAYLIILNDKCSGESDTAVLTLGTKVSGWLWWDLKSKQIGCKRHKVGKRESSRRCNGIFQVECYEKGIIHITSIWPRFNINILDMPRNPKHLVASEFGPNESYNLCRGCRWIDSPNIIILVRHALYGNLCHFVHNYFIAMRS